MNCLAACSHTLRLSYCVLMQKRDKQKEEEKKKKAWISQERQKNTGEAESIQGEVSSSCCPENILSPACQSQVATRHPSAGCGTVPCTCTEPSDSPSSSVPCTYTEPSESPSSSVPYTLTESKGSSRAATEHSACRRQRTKTFESRYPSRYPCPDFCYCW